MAFFSKTNRFDVCYEQGGKIVVPPRLALTVANVAVLGTTTRTTARLLTVTTTTRTTATTTMASALFAPRSSPFIFAYAQNHIG